MKETVLDIFAELENGKKKINSAQKTMLKQHYNLHTGNFNYKVDNWNSLIIECNDDTFKNLEYYAGLEYERNNQEVLIKVENKVIVSYSGTERVEQLIKRLEELEETAE